MAGVVGGEMVSKQAGYWCSWERKSYVSTEHRVRGAGPTAGLMEVRPQEELLTGSIKHPALPFNRHFLRSSSQGIEW